MHSLIVLLPTGFTGVDSTYEPPSDPDLVLKAGEWTVSECVDHVINMLEQNVSAMIMCTEDPTLSGHKITKVTYPLNQHNPENWIYIKIAHKDFMCLRAWFQTDINS